MWQQAQLMYESAQAKARGGTMHFSPSEYNVWEDHWVLCGMNLQQVRSCVFTYRSPLKSVTVGHPWRAGEIRRQYGSRS